MAKEKLATIIISAMPLWMHTPSTSAAMRVGRHSMSSGKSSSQYRVTTVPATVSA